MKSKTFKAIFGTLIIIAVAVASFLIIRRFPPMGRIMLLAVDVAIFYLVRQLFFTDNKPKIQ